MEVRLLVFTINSILFYLLNFNTTFDKGNRLIVLFLLDPENDVVRKVAFTVG